MLKNTKLKGGKQSDAMHHSSSQLLANTSSSGQPSGNTDLHSNKVEFNPSVDVKAPTNSNSVFDNSSRFSIELGKNFSAEDSHKSVVSRRDSPIKKPGNV